MSTKLKKVIAVTGARSEYDLLSPIFELLSKDDRFDFSILITGSHLKEKYGNTANLIKADGYNIAAEIDNLCDTGDELGRVVSTGDLISSMARVLEGNRPDILLIAGDREEAIATCMVGGFLGIATAHFFGGDIAKDGNIDNAIRYAASKFAHIHFPTLEQHKQTLLKLGEDEERIFVVGNPALDKFINTPHISRRELGERLGVSLGTEPYCILIQHPIVTEIHEQEYNIKATLDAIKETGLTCFLNYPNSDAGNKAIINAIEDFSATNETAHLFKNLDRNTYINLLRNAHCLVGNSSSGILEAPSIGLPVVNVGTRQRGRVHAGNVLFTEYNKDEIRSAIEISVFDIDYRNRIESITNPYGSGDTAKLVVDVLSEVEINNWLIYKNITYSTWRK